MLEKRIAIVVTHPIQYYAPFFQLLSKCVKIKVFYTWGEGSISKFDLDFRKEIKWDIPLLEGYDYEFLKNNAQRAGSHHFLGIKNPDAIEKIEIFQPDAILIYGWSYLSHLKIIRHFNGKTPVWFRGDSTLLDEDAGWKVLARTTFLRWLYSYIDKAFYVGSANRAYYKKFGLSDEQLIFAPHAIDNSRFAKDRTEEAQELRQALGIGVERKLILFAGKLEPKKNPELLLDAFISLNLRGVHLLFVGNGVLEQKLKDKAANQACVDVRMRIHFIDFKNQQEMPVMYQACDLFCLPSKGPGETWGLAVNEAMAAGRTVLVSDKVGCAQDLVRNSNGKVFKSDDLDDLIKSISFLCSENYSLKESGLNSRSIIQDWTFQNFVKKTINSL